MYWILGRYLPWKAGRVLSKMNTLYFRQVDPRMVDSSIVLTKCEFQCGTNLWVMNISANVLVTTFGMGHPVTWSYGLCLLRILRCNDTVTKTRYHQERLVVRKQSLLFWNWRLVKIQNIRETYLIEFCPPGRLVRCKGTCNPKYLYRLYERTILSSTCNSFLKILFANVQCAQFVWHASMSSLKVKTL